MATMYLGGEPVAEKILSYKETAFNREGGWRLLKRLQLGWLALR